MKPFADANTDTYANNIRMWGHLARLGKAIRLSGNKCLLMKKLLIVILLLTSIRFLDAQETYDVLLKARAASTAGRNDEALRILSEGNKGDIRILLERSEIYISKGDYQSAITDLNGANAVSTGAGDFGLSRIYALRREASTSMYHLASCLHSPFRRTEKEIMLDPIENSPEWRNFWKEARFSTYEKSIAEMEYYYSAGRKEEAESVLSVLGREYAGTEGYRYAASLVSMMGSKYSDAVRQFSALIAENPGNERYLRLLAEAQVASGNAAGASVTYTKLIDSQVPDAKLFADRAGCFLKTGETNRARTDIRRFLELYPDDTEALRLAGKIENAAGDNLAAIAMYTDNLKLHPDDPRCYTDRGDAYFLARSWKLAADDYSMALDLSPINGNAWLNKGIALLNTGNRDDACNDFRMALKHGNRRAAEYISANCLK